MENKKTLLIRKYKAGYEVRTELCTFGADDSTVTVKSAYTPNGEYIGNSKMAHFLIAKRGIKPERASLDHNVCSIGFCEREQKWFGWSHRAIYGFSIGDTVKDGDCCASSGWTDEYLAEHPEEGLSLPIGFQAKTLNDCKRMAIAFAASVS